MRERPKSLDGAGLFRAVSPITPHKRAWLRRFDSGRDRFREVAVTESAGASPLKAVAFPDYSRSIPRPTTALTNDPSESFPPSCFFVGSLSVWWRVGTLAAAAASPQAKPTQRSRADAVDELIQQEEEDPVGRVLHSLLPAASPLTALIPATLRPSDS